MDVARSSIPVADVPPAGTAAGLVASGGANAAMVAATQRRTARTLFYGGRTVAKKKAAKKAAKKGAKKTAKKSATK
jgi:hypothetical protein